MLEGSLVPILVKRNTHIFSLFFVLKSVVKHLNRLYTIITSYTRKKQTDTKETYPFATPRVKKWKSILPSNFPFPHLTVCNPFREWMCRRTVISLSVQEPPPTNIPINRLSHGKSQGERWIMGYVTRWAANSTRFSSYCTHDHHHRQTTQFHMHINKLN